VVEEEEEEKGKSEPSGKEKAEGSDKQELKENRKKDAKALFLIQQSISEKIFPRITGARSSKEAWEILQKEFQGSDKVRSVKLLTIKRDFQNLQMRENEALKDYFSIVMEIVNQIRSLGENLIDKSVCEKIFISLSPKYNNIGAIIEETKDLSTLSVHDLMGSLEMHEQWLGRHTEQSIESAFQSRLNVKEQSKQSPAAGGSFRGGRFGRGHGRFGRGGGRNNNNVAQTRCNICKRASHVEKDCWFKGKPQCHKCKKFGHIKKDCWLKSNEQANYTKEKSGDGSTFFACQAAIEQKNDVWYVDSGCSNHMIGDESMFFKLDTTNTTQITMGNGAVVKSKGKGTLSLLQRRAGC